MPRLLVLFAIAAIATAAQAADAPWPRYTIDNTSRGADGVRLMDVNGDKLPEVVTGWEEGGVIRVYLHPGYSAAKLSWPKMTVGKVRSPEDAVFVDLDGDGAVDVVSSCEGRTKSVFVHWAPRPVKDPKSSPESEFVRRMQPEYWSDGMLEQWRRNGPQCPLQYSNTPSLHSQPSLKSRINIHTAWALTQPKDTRDYLNEKKWTTAAFPATKNLTRWMFAVPMQVDGKHGVDLVIGSKNPNAQIGWLESPKNPRDLSAWKRHTIHKAGWIMSLFAIDIDGDGDKDIVTTDRKGPKRGCYWLENPGAGKQAGNWQAHPIGGLKREVMFVKPCDLDGDKRQDFVIAVKGGDILFCKRTGDSKPKWTEHGIQSPANIGTGKAVAVGDIDGDGRQDIVLSCENAKNASGVVWLSRPTGKPATHREWVRHEISGNKRGIKFDRIELLDIDGDGDLDVLTCEERHNLGVIWYANPRR